MSAPFFDYAQRGLTPSRARPLIPNGPQTVAEILDGILAVAPDREALVDRFTRYSYAELDAAASRAASALRGLGVERWDRVAASVGNGADVVIAFLATLRLGAIWVGINRPLASPEKAFILRDAGARVFLGDPEMAAQVSSTRRELPDLQHVVSLEPGDSSSEWAQLCARAEAQRPGLDIDPFAPAAIAYTSGTSGFPKGAVHSQHNLVLPGAVARSRGELTPDTRHGCVLPLTILNLMVLGPLTALQRGGACVMMDRIDAASVAAWIRAERIGYFAGVPTLLYDLLHHPEVRAQELATLRRVLIGGADCPEALVETYRERFGTEVIIGYGMTEAPTAVTVTDGTRAPAAGECGAALPQVEIHIVDEHDRDLAAGQVGEICVAPATRGSWAGIYTPMLGYWNQPEATAEALRGGRFHSGDLGTLAPAGALTLRGRRSDLILRGGANVYPAEIERILHQDGRVAACAVIGKADPRLGERVVALIQLKPGQKASADELQKLCAHHLARYKIPEEFFFIEALPRNSMGKIVKRELYKVLGAE